MTREEIESGLVYARAALTARMSENDVDGAANVAMALLALETARTRFELPSNAPAVKRTSAPASPCDGARIVNFESAKRALASRPRVYETRADAQPLRRPALRLYCED